MARRLKSRHSLSHHQLVIERSLADVRAGKKLDHLSQLDVAQMITGLEKRLAAVSESLAKVEHREDFS